MAVKYFKLHGDNSPSDYALVNTDDPSGLKGLEPYTLGRELSIDEALALKNDGFEPYCQEADADEEGEYHWQVMDVDIIEAVR